MVVAGATTQAAGATSPIRSGQRIITAAADKGVIAGTTCEQVAASGLAACVQHSGMAGPGRNERVVAAAETTVQRVVTIGIAVINRVVTGCGGVAGASVKHQGPASPAGNNSVVPSTAVDCIVARAIGRKAVITRAGNNLVVARTRVRQDVIAVPGRKQNILRSGHRNVDVVAGGDNGIDSSDRIGGDTKARGRELSDVRALARVDRWDARAAWGRRLILDSRRRARPRVDALRVQVLEYLVLGGGIKVSECTLECCLVKIIGRHDTFPARSLSGVPCPDGPRISVLMAHGVAGALKPSGSFFGRLSPRSPFCQHFKRYRARRSITG